MKIFKILFAAKLILGVGVTYQSAYGADFPCSNGTPCELSGENAGTYHLTYPKGWDGKQKLKPFVFFHEHNGSGKRVARNKSLANELGKSGFLLVAPDGPMFTFGERSSRGWAARPEDNPRGGRDDIAFVERVLDDVARRVPTIAKSTVLSGFSSGGSMAWYMGCYSQRHYAAIAALAGGLRRPVPSASGSDATGADLRKCPGGARKMLHIHGFTDKQVPLEGRGIRAWHQGDVFEGLSIQRTTNQCGSKPTKVESKGKFWCRDWTGCGSKQPVRFCLHSGGHGMPSGWLDQTLRWAK